MGYMNNSLPAVPRTALSSLDETAYKLLEGSLDYTLGLIRLHLYFSIKIEVYIWRVQLAMISLYYH